jgi:hypothetical protein
MKRLCNAEGLVQEDHDYLQGLLQREYEEHLKDLRGIFLGHRYDNRPHMVFPTTKADLDRMDTMINDFHAISLEFIENYKTGLTSSQIMHLPK